MPKKQNPKSEARNPNQALSSKSENKKESFQPEIKKEESHKPQPTPIVQPKPEVKKPEAQQPKPVQPAQNKIEEQSK